MIRGTVAVALLAMTLTGCSGSEPEPNAAPTETPEAATVTLADACTVMEQRIPDDGILSAAGSWRVFKADLEKLEATGDADTQAAVAILLAPVETLMADPEPGTETIDADRDLLAALGTLADRCEAVGSPAFQ